MSSSIHILGFTGSLSEKSLNRAALEVARGMVPEGAEMEIVSPGNLPLYNRDLENDEPEVVRSFKNSIREADALFIVTPEYNYSIPGVLKNAIDWASRPQGESVMTGKPTAIMGVGGRFGTVRAQLALRQILLYLDVPVLTKPEVYITNGWEKFDEEGNLKDEQVHQQMQMLVDALVRYTRERVR